METKSKLKRLGLVGIVCSNLVYSSCEKNTDPTPIYPSTTNQTQNIQNGKGSYPAPTIADFGVDFPVSGGTVQDYRSVMTGHGLEHGSTLDVTVTTTKPYPQVGITTINPDHTWKYDPIYFGGYSHDILVVARFPDGSSKDVEINNVTR